MPAQPTPPPEVEPAGDPYWLRALQSPRFALGAMTFEPDGTLVMAGGMERGGLQGEEPFIPDTELNAFVARFDGAGRVVSSFTWGLGLTLDAARAIALFEGGDYAIAGYTDVPVRMASADAPTNADLRRVSPAGEVVWAKSFGSLEDDCVNCAAEYADAVVIGADQTVYAAGTLRGAAMLDDVMLGPGTFVVALEPTTGEVRWGTTLPRGPHRLTLGADGVFVVIGELVDTAMLQNQPGDLVLVKLGLDGGMAWEHHSELPMLPIAGLMPSTRPFGLAYDGARNQVIAFTAQLSQPSGAPAQYVATSALRFDATAGGTPTAAPLTVGDGDHPHAVAQVDGGYVLAGTTYRGELWQLRMWMVDESLSVVGDADPLQGEIYGEVQLAASEDTLVVTGENDPVALDASDPILVAGSHRIEGRNLAFVLALAR